MPAGYGTGILGHRLGEHGVELQKLGVWVGSGLEDYGVWLCWASSLRFRWAAGDTSLCLQLGEDCSATHLHLRQALAYEGFVKHVSREAKFSFRQWEVALNRRSTEVLRISNHGLALIGLRDLISPAQLRKNKKNVAVKPWAVVGITCVQGASSSCGCFKKAGGGREGGSSPVPAEMLMIGIVSSTSWNVYIGPMPFPRDSRISIEHLSL